VLAEDSGTFSAPDAAIDVNGDSSFGSVASGGSLNIGVENTNGAFIGAFDNNTNSWVIGDSAVANSDNSYQVSLPATDSLALPDQSIEVNNVVEGSIPSVGTIDINLSDGTNVITPTSVAVTGRVVDIELPGGLVMAVDFVADKLVATAGETITFTDLTNNSPTNWGWLFNGDGSSNLQNPTFSFSTLGFKNITLFAAKTGLGGFTTKSSYIEIIGLLLDVYPNAAAAYSLRLIRGAYTGSAIRVRRSNDNTEQDIGFVNNVLDTAALLSFVGANNGFVVTWYDQSGNGQNATQSTQANQPQIVSSGVVELSGGLPALLWTNGQGQRLINSLLSISQPLTSFVVTKLSAASGINASIIYDSFQTNTHVLFNSGNSEAPNNRLLYITSATVDISASTTNMELITSLANGSSSVFRKNGVQVATGNVGTNALSGLSIGNLRGNPTPFLPGYDYSGHISELIFYPSNQTSNFAGIETNIQTFYGI
jgi:PKD repeat protein